MSLFDLLLKAVRTANGTEAVRRDLATRVDQQTADLVAHANHQTADLLAHFDRLLGMRGRHEALGELCEMSGTRLRELAGLSDTAIDVLTRKPVACDSPDHLMPWGTRLDNSANLRFNLKLARWIAPESLSVLDLGCAGGGFVKSILDLGCLAVGIEGSDYSKVRLRAEWATIPEYLFTADITEPFTVVGRRAGQQQQPVKFVAVTAWEVIEHICRERLPAVFANIDAHLQTSGVVVMSVSSSEDVVNNVALHQTVEGRDWWLGECARHGFEHHEEAVEYFGDDWVRGGDNAPGSFPLVLTRKGEPLPALPM